MRRPAVTTLAVAAVLCGTLSLCGGPTPGGGHTAAAAESEPIDWERARRLHEKVRRGESLTPEERAYYERARRERAARRGGRGAAPDERPGGPRERRRPAPGEPGPTPVPPASAMPQPARLPAFPGAEGAGAASVGGRGGRVHHVTTLADRGPGSLRAAVDASGPRIIVFDVGGTIELGSPLHLDRPYVTIAGETAPGGGIALKATPSIAHPLVYVTTHDVVIRYLRIRPGPGARGSMGLTAITIETPEARDVIVDHVSMSWAVDKCLTIFDGARNVTVQWSILAETLYCANHGKTVNWSRYGTRGSCPDGGVPHSRAVTISSPPDGPPAGDITLHHNLLAHNDMRHPNVVGAGPVDFVNNVIYDLGTLGANLGAKPGSAHGATLDYVGNYIKPGPSTDRGVTALSAPRFITTGVSVFVDGNVGTEAIGGLFPSDFGRLGFLSTTRHSALPVRADSAEEALTAVLQGAGARLPSLDAADRRILEDVRAGTGSLIDHPAEVGGWPRLESGAPPTDHDRDGLPAAWEARCAYLDDREPADARSDHDGDGYTEIEEYLHCLAAGGGPEAALGCPCDPAEATADSVDPAP